MWVCVLKMIAAKKQLLLLFLDLSVALLAKQQRIKTAY